ncbi:MAG: DUF1326 domain-containing protein [Acidimicrobiales bacterium]
MAFDLVGTYFESCSCDMVCPCTWSGLTAKATQDRCRAVLAYHVDRGEIEGTDVSGLSFALYVDTPPIMSEGNWRAGILIDDRADTGQGEKLQSFLGGAYGGPPAMLGPFISEMLGVERVAIDYRDDGRNHSISIGSSTEIEVRDFVAGDGTEPVQMTNVFHPSNSTLTLAPTVKATVNAFGDTWGREGQSGFSAPFTWAG